MRVWFYNNGGIGLICLHSHYNLDICILQFDNQLEKLCTFQVGCQENREKPEITEPYSMQAT